MESFDKFMDESERFNEALRGISASLDRITANVREFNVKAAAFAEVFREQEIENEGGNHEEDL